LLKVPLFVPVVLFSWTGVIWPLARSFGMTDDTSLGDTARYVAKDPY
jgi:hypothetical protein